MARTQKDSVERDAYSVDEFCRRHSICRANFYNLVRAGQGPLIKKAGKRTLISKEAAAAWRNQGEQTCAGKVANVS
jgi:hypothetical protein